MFSSIDATIQSPKCCVALTRNQPHKRDTQGDEESEGSDIDDSSFQGKRAK
jgi:hypothetical protein